MSGAGAAGGAAAADVTADAVAVAGEEGAAWVAELGAAVPREADPWHEPFPGLAAPPELEGAWREPR